MLLNGPYMLLNGPHMLPERPHMLPISPQDTESKKVISPELIELIEQEGATRFFVKIWGGFGAC